MSQLKDLGFRDKDLLRLLSNIPLRTLNHGPWQARCSCRPDSNVRMASIDLNPARAGKLWDQNPRALRL